MMILRGYYDNGRRIDTNTSFFLADTLHLHGTNKMKPNLFILFELDVINIINYICLNHLKSVLNRKNNKTKPKL